MNIQDIRQEEISATLIPAFLAGTVGAYKSSYQGKPMIKVECGKR